MTSIFRIVLRDVKRYDTYETRQFDLPLNATFPIGRASSNVTKKDLMAAPHNAYIDSPVISRQHAVLSANASSGTPEVYISDQASMHGTMLNGQRLPPKTPTKLKYGDELQFGTDVNRNEEFFVARKYVFESQLSRPFSLGFTVPDAESEDEEVERPGSHADPFVIDSDSDMAPEKPDQDNQADTTLIAEDALQQEQPVKRSRFGPDVYPESTLKAEDAYDEDNDNDNVSGADFEAYGDCILEARSPSLCGGFEDDGASVDLDFDSKAGSSDGSEMDSESDSDIRDSENEVDGAGYSEAATTSAIHETQYSNNDIASPSQNSAGALPSNMPARNIFTHGDACSYLPRLQGVDMFELQQPDKNENTLAESSRSVMTKVATTDRLPPDTAPPLPPRPSSQQASWGSWPHLSCGQYEAQGWYQGDIPQANYLSVNYGDQSSLFNSAPHPPAPKPTDARPSVSFCQQANQASQVDGLQTPPPAPTSDIDAYTPLQPGRRTKVSIEEIVEEVIEMHPPTPESVNYKKRKADAFDEEPTVIEAAMPQQAAIGVEQKPGGSANSDSAMETVATQTAVQIAQRPKKTPRSVVSRVLNKAAYPLLGATGAVVSFALLSTLPDNFFM